MPTHSAIDISDGLSAVLAHICEQSHCGALLDLAAIPIPYLLKEEELEVH